MLKKILEINSEIKQINQLINLVKNDNDKIILRKDLSNLNFELSCIYSSPFWSYSRIWGSFLGYGIGSCQYPPFNVLKPEYISSKLDSFLSKYGNQYKSIEYLKKSIKYTDDFEKQAQYNFKLYFKLKNPFSTSFHKRIYKNDMWQINLNQKKEILYINMLKGEIFQVLNSKYKKTNYFADVISECSDFKNNKSINKEYLAAKLINNNEKVINNKIQLKDKLFILFFLIFIAGVFNYIRSK